MDRVELGKIDGKLISTSEVSGSTNPFMLVDPRDKDDNRDTLIIKMLVAFIENELYIQISSQDYAFISEIYQKNKKEITTFDDILGFMQSQNIKSSSEQKIVESLANWLKKY